MTAPRVAAQSALRIAAQSALSVAAQSALRVVSLLPSATEIVAALGFADALVGRSHECDYPEEVADLPVCTEAKVNPAGSSEEIHRSVNALLAESLSVYRVDAERLRALAPTHVVTQVQCQVCAVSLEEVEAALAGWTGERPRLTPLNPGSLADVLADIERVGAALGAPERGRRLAASIRASMEAIAERASAIPFRPRVVTLEWLSPLMTAGNWMPEIIAMAGGRDLLGAARTHSSWIEWETVRAADPDVLLVFPCGFPLERVVREIGLLTERPGWAALRVVSEGRVYLAEANQYFNRPGPRLLETLEIVAEILHPQDFAFGHEGKGWLRLTRAGARLE
ncbi:MAG TPA: cobalamin-binding protein [Thermoanaerobaculia bacterium]